MEKALTVKQIAELASVADSVVLRAMRRGHLPSQEPVVVGEWLKTLFERDRSLGAEERKRLLEGSRAW